MVFIIMSKYVVKVWSNGDRINQSKKRDDISRFYLGELETEMIMKSQSTDWVKSSLKKSTVSERLSNRDKIGNINRNPYMIGNNYLEDLMVQDTFLRPKISGFEDPKKE